MREENGDERHPRDMTEAEFHDWARGMWEGLASQPVQFVWEEGAPTLTALVKGEDDEPVIEMELHRDGLRPVTLTVRKREGLTSADIRIPLERLIDRVEAAVKVSGVPASRHGGPVGDAPVGQRRRLTDTFLKDVVDAYVAAGMSVSGINASVDPRFEASDSQKFRWLRQARDRGLLSEDDD